MQNIIENSIKYQNPNISDAYVKITINELSPEKIQIIISDNGLGIDPSIQCKIFDMYFKGNHDSKGSGLGLYLVKKSIEKLDAEITFTSALKIGTTFIINLN